MADYPHRKSSIRRRSMHRWVFLGFLIIAGYFFFTEHRAHAIQFLPFVLLLACPLLHVLHGHGGHGSDHGGAQTGEHEQPQEGRE